MTKNKSLRGLSVAALAATALFAAQPAAADVIEINNFWAGHGTVNISFTGTDWHTGDAASVHETTGAGGFLTYNLTTDSGMQNGFQSFCVDIFHSFSPAVDSNDTLQPASTVLGTQAAADLGMLYSNHHADIAATSGNATNEAAFQLAVWEIVNEGSDHYDINGGEFSASGTGSALAQQWLDELAGGNGGHGDYSANIWTVQDMITTGHGYAQDVVVFAPVPEPQTYAMMLVGLGLLGFSARRKSQNLG
jgi:hypothetical protein